MPVTLCKSHLTPLGRLLSSGMRVTCDEFVDHWSIFPAFVLAPSKSQTVALQESFTNGCWTLSLVSLSVFHFSCCVVGSLNVWQQWQAWPRCQCHSPWQSRKQVTWHWLPPFARHWLPPFAMSSWVSWPLFCVFQAIANAEKRPAVDQDTADETEEQVLSLCACVRFCICTLLLVCVDVCDRVCFY